MKNPKISVIVPVYNVEQYLHRCIDSILAQTFTDFELLLIDDGSKDRSGEICDEYAGKDERVRVFHKENGGVSSARNLGIDNAKGEWISFVDGDDVINPKIKWNLIVEDINEADYVLFNGRDFIDSKDGKDNIEDFYGEDYKINSSLKKADFLLKYVCHNHFLIWYRKDLIEKYNIRFTIGMKVAEDEEFQLKYLIVCSKPIKIDGILYFYRIRNGSAMNNPQTNFEILSCSETLFSNLFSFLSTYYINEKWLFYRLESVLKQYLSALSNISIMEYLKRQTQYRKLVRILKEMKFPYSLNFKLKLAYLNVFLYVFLFKLYQSVNLKIKKNE